MSNESQDMAAGDDGLRRRRRMLVAIVAVALASATIGWLAGRTIESPEEAARRAAAPDASPITVPVERQVLESSVVTRGNVQFAEAVEVEVPTSIGDGAIEAAVVTGRVPAAGDQLAEGEVALEVSGRPVLLLAGELPTYRALRPGLSGRDVRQLEEALARLGFLARTPGDTYNSQTQTAVQRWYESVGYVPVGPSPEQEQQLAAAAAAVDAAETAHGQAEQALAAAQAPPPRSAVLAAEGEVEQAQLAYGQLAEECAEVSCQTDPAQADLKAALAAAASRLAVAQAQLAELTAPPDTSAQEQAVEDAATELDEAKEALAELASAVGVQVPYGEVMFVPSLPRRVDQVTVALGDVPAGPVMSLTGAELQAVAAVPRQEAELLQVGQPARLDDPLSGVDLRGTVSAVAAAQGTNGAGPGQHAVVITPEGGDPAELAGLNLRVTIPIESTDGAVLAVPLGALVTDATGTTRVRVVRGDGFEEVTVMVGLAAGGFAEVSPAGGALDAGDLVVVGQQR